MRRKLEKLYFPGYWTSDSHSNLIGIGKKYQYHFKVIPKAGNLFDFFGKKTHNISGKMNTIGDFNKKNISKKELISMEKKFINWVIENAA